MIPWLAPGAPFPPVRQALRRPDGLLCASDELGAARVLEAYRLGIFPWYSEGQPVLWWSTDPRMVLHTAELRVTDSLRRRYRKLKAAGMEVRCDTAFPAVITACAAPRDADGGTWINQAMMATYTELFEQGVAHSIETWIDGQLAGGLYGLSIGRMFYGESMFMRVSDASKIALLHLVDLLCRQGCPMIDCQQQTAHLASMGARPVPREAFVREVARLTALPGLIPWPAGESLSLDVLSA